MCASAKERLDHNAGESVYVCTGIGKGSKHAHVTSLVTGQVVQARCETRRMSDVVCLPAQKKSEKEILCEVPVVFGSMESGQKNRVHQRAVVNIVISAESRARTECGKKSASENGQHRYKCRIACRNRVWDKEKCAAKSCDIKTKCGSRKKEIRTEKVGCWNQVVEVVHLRRCSRRL